MNIENQFNLIAKEYDINRRRFIPCFEDFYVNTTELLAKTVKMPKRILDLGAGTGLLSMYWYKTFPNAEFTLDDIAEEMLDGAKKRFAEIENVKFVTDNYCNALPAGDFDLIISALSIHHLEDNEKINLFKAIYDRLPIGGAFINYDQFCFDNKNFSLAVDSAWVNALEKSDLSEKDLQLWKERRKLDRECSAQKEIQMLRETGFKNTECIYSYQKFSVVSAVK